MRTMCMLLVVAIGSLTVSGCATMNGIGQDIRTGGAAIQRAASR